ncbi:hypothetical protein [Rhizobium sp. FKL33]|uniref:hypothetical protein n=1 Tax=Rhizobium sp. FKL33 TaxID=2562307 RepID=UPI0010C06060|nr:hypothetical protein [Rhizobium sp. FKL33]
MKDDTLSNGRQALEQQLATLREQIADISEALSGITSDAADAARPRLRSASKQARHAAHALRLQGEEAVETVRAHPGAATSIAVTAGLIGAAIGYLAGAASASEPPRSKWRF